jgi:hypothetical protein
VCSSTVTKIFPFAAISTVPTPVNIGIPCKLKASTEPIFVGKFIPVTSTTTSEMALSFPVTTLKDCPVTF